MLLSVDSLIDALICASQDEDYCICALND